MEQVIFGGSSSDLLHDTNTNYNSLTGKAWWVGTEWTYSNLMSPGGKIKCLRVKLDDAPGGTDKYTFTVMLNGAPTALTLEIVGAATSGSDMTHEIDVVGGNWISLRCVPTDTPVARYATWTVVFEGSTAAESWIGGTTEYYGLFRDPAYGQVMSGFTDTTSGEDAVREVCPTSGTIKKLYVELSETPGPDPTDGLKITLRKGGVSQTLTVTILQGSTTGSDLVNEVAVVAGDILTIKIEVVDTPNPEPMVKWGMTFEADTDNESLVLGGSSVDLDDTDTEYNSPQCIRSYPWVADETTRYQLGQVCTLKKLYMLLSAAPGVGNKYNFTLRVAGGDGNVTVEIADPATTGNSGALEDAIALDNYVDLKVVPDDTPDVAKVYWGLVCFREPGWSGKISGVVDPASIMGVAVADIASVKGVA